MRTKLTRDLIGSLKPAVANDVFAWDTAVVGLGVRVKPSGTKSYVVQYRMGAGRGSKSVRITIDDVTSVSLEDARKVARSNIGSVAMGGDPRQQRRAETIQVQKKVSKVIDAYDKDFEQRQVVPRHRTNSVSILRRGLEKFQARDVSSLSRQELVEAIETITKPGAQQAFRQRLTPFLNFAVNQGLSKYNVLAGWKRPRRSKIQSAIAKGRSLSAAEVRAVWKATEIQSVFNQFIRVMLLTGLRNAETASLDWMWIDKILGAIVVPGHRMKSGKSHAVPLTPELQNVLSSIPKISKTTLMFPVRSKQRTWTTMSGFGQMLRKLHRESGTGGWTIYDLRRTYRSTIADLNFDLDLCERMIAHSRGNLVERYDKSTRWLERLALAKAYSAHVIRLTSNAEASTSQIDMTTVPILQTEVESTLAGANFHSNPHEKNGFTPLVSN